MDFKSLIFKYFSGNLRIHDLPVIGITGIQEGYDSPSLIILAGLDKSDNSFEIEKYFNDVLKELGFDIPSERQACINYALAIADEVIAGKRDIIVGVREIYQNALHNYDFYSETKKYVYDSIGLECIYGLYIEYDELEQACIPAGKSKEQIASDITKFLILELIKWKESF